ncbi:MAG: hypothetical protein IKF09_04375 [Clostridiales bacterium]|nr:hypothetical protein [Clostridiales bacterium]
MKLQTEIFEKFDKGWLLYEAADERQSRPWQSVADMDYDKLCSWADIMGV